jgi:hypothetical protein
VTTVLPVFAGTLCKPKLTLVIIASSIQSLEGLTARIVAPIRPEADNSILSCFHSEFERRSTLTVSLPMSDLRCDDICIGDGDAHARRHSPLACPKQDVSVLSCISGRFVMFFLCKCGGQFCYRGSDGKEKGRSSTYRCRWAPGIWLQPHLGLKHLVNRGQIRRTRIEWPRWAKAGRLNERRGVSARVRHRN